METDWFSLGDVAVFGNRIQAKMTLRPDSPWFQGHFPGNPVLPGVAQLIFVIRMIRHVFGQNNYIAGIRKVRFKRMIRPGEPLLVIVETSQNSTGRYSFRIECDDELAAKGVMIVDQETTGQLIDKMVS